MHQSAPNNAREPNTVFVRYWLVFVEREHYIWSDGLMGLQEKEIAATACKKPDGFVDHKTSDQSEGGHFEKRMTITG